jgi:plastocyanin
MSVLRLLSAWGRGCAAVALSLVILVALPGDVRASDTQISITQQNDTMSLRYDPSSLSVSAGSTITWTNNGATSITITSPDGLFDSDSVSPGNSFSHTFDTPGTYRYFCVPFPHMKGIITVVPSPDR